MLNFIKNKFYRKCLIVIFILSFQIPLKSQTISYDCNADAWIRINSSCLDWQDTNYGNSLMMQCNSWTYSFLSCGSGNNRSLIFFDLTETVPANYLYDNRAELLLFYPDIYPSETQNYLGSATENSFKIFKLSEPWAENTVTWDNQPGVISTTPIFVPATVTVPSFLDYTIDLSDFVASWICEPENNFGIKMQLTNEQTYRRVSFATREYDQEDHRPQLRCYYSSISAVGPDTTCGDFEIYAVLENAEIPSNYTFSWTHLNSGTQHSGQYWNNPVYENGLNTYVLTVENTYCQSATDTINIVSSELDFTLPDSVIFCNSNAEIVCENEYYQYTWSNGQTGHIFSSDHSGDFSVTVSSGFGCSTIETFSIIIDNFTATINPVSVSCFNGNDGSIEISSESHYIPFEFYLNGVLTTLNTLSNLESGFYNLSIVNNIGCEEIFNNIIINEPDEITANVASIFAQNCNSPGEINLNVAGGIMPYTFHWSNNTVSIIGSCDSLFAGSYTVTITDSNNCESIFPFNINNEVVLNPLINIIKPFSCYYDSLATIEAICSNGTSPFVYLWSNNSSDSLINVTLPGTYGVFVNDSNNCFGYAEVIIERPDSIQAISTISNVSCNGFNDGSITNLVTGGVAPYSYNWNNGTNTSSINNIAQGFYSLTIIDNNNCIFKKDFIISQPDSLFMIINHTNPLCFDNKDGNISIDVYGGSPDFTYVVNNQEISILDNIITGLAAGPYHILILDSHGCSIVDSVMIETPVLPETDFNLTNPTCFRFSDGSIQFSIIGGESPYVYYLNDFVSYDEFIDSLPANNYFARIIDNNNCLIFQEVISLIDNPNNNCINIPNAFTPNFDGINDYWIIENIWRFPEAKIQIFNRWGQELWSASGADAPWDGKYQDDFVPTGPYLYIVNLFNGINPFVGIVTVVF